MKKYLVVVKHDNFPPNTFDADTEEQARTLANNLTGWGAVSIFLHIETITKESTHE